MNYLNFIVIVILVHAKNQGPYLCTDLFTNKGLI